jgi:hypothetical protein
VCCFCVIAYYLFSTDVVLLTSLSCAIWQEPATPFRYSAKLLNTLFKMLII